MIFVHDVVSRSSLILLRSNQLVARHKAITNTVLGVLILASTIYFFRGTVNSFLVKYRINHPSPCAPAFCQQNPFNGFLEGGCFCPHR